MTKTVGPPLLLVLAAALAFAGCVARPDVGAASPEPITTAELPPSPAIETAPSITPMTAEDFWASLFDGDRDFATYPSMQALAMDADAVVIASFASLERGPTYTDQYGNVMYEGALTLSIDRVLHGVVNTRTPGTLVVLVNLGFGFAEHAPDPWQERLASLQAAVPLGRGVFFLANMAAWIAETGGDPKRPEADPYLYMVLSSQGFVREVSGRAEPPAWATSGWPAALRGRNFGEVVAEIAKTKPGN